MVVARRPSPPPPPPARHEHRDTEIDIYTSDKRTEVDIHKHSHSHSHSRGRSVERPSRPIVYANEDDVVVTTDRKHLHLDIERRRSVSRPRARSAAPPVIDYEDEAYEIKSRIDQRGKDYRRPCSQKWM